MSKKERRIKNEEKNASSIFNNGNILKVGASANELSTDSVRISISNKNRVITEEEIDEVLKNIFIPGRMSVDSNKMATVIFDDGKKKKYHVSDIIVHVAEQAEMHIKRFYTTLAAFSKYYLEKKNAVIDDNFEEDSDIEPIDELVVELYDAHNNNKEETPEERKIGIMKLYDKLIVNDFVSAFYMWEFLKKMTKYMKNPQEVRDYISSLQNLTKKCVDQIDDKGNSEYIMCRYINEVINPYTDDSEMLRFEYRAGRLNDDDVVNILLQMFNPEELKRYIEIQGTKLVDRKNVIRQLINRKIITEEELKNLIDGQQALIDYLSTGSNELLKYIEVEELALLYMNKNIDLHQFTKYTTLDELLLSSLDAQEKMEILCSAGNSRVYSKTNTSLIWDLYEDDYFTCDDIKKLEQLRYVHTDTIIEKYIEQQRRKIATELGKGSNISASKLLEFFTPDVVLKGARAGMTEQRKIFYNSMLNKIYSDADRKFDLELVNEIMTDKQSTEKAKYAECISLSKEGIISKETLATIGIPEEVIVDELVDMNDESTIINCFNNGLISQDTVYELYGNRFDDEVFELISKGMSAKVIEGLYSTAQLIEFAKTSKAMNGDEIPARLTFENLAEIKGDINTEIPGNADNKSNNGSTSLLDLYLNNELTYSELYGLADAGVISIEVANEINEQYNLGRDVEKLKQKGVSGQPLENLYKPQLLQELPEAPKQKPGRKSATVGGSFGFDSKYIAEFYKRMGAEDMIEINPDNCPVFNGYVIIPIIEKKIGFLEGTDGRTYILPLKIILEQINNPGSQMDLIGTATSRNGFNRNKNYVRSTNHTKNWIENTAKKAAEVSPVMTEKDAREFRKNNESLIKAVKNSYEDRKAYKLI